VISTTNGTRTLLKSLDAEEILAGAFLNFQATMQYLSDEPADLVIHCAGWKGTVNLEDSLYAGALIDALRPQYGPKGDSSYLVEALFHQHKHDMQGAANKSAHAARLAGFGTTEDIEYAMRPDVAPSLVKYEKGHLIKI